MRALSIQVQPERSPGLDVDRLVATFTDIAGDKRLVRHHQFDRGRDTLLYLNFTFGTDDAPSLWRLIETRLYADEELGSHMRAASMAMCSSANGWDRYVILYHFDPAVKRDPMPAFDNEGDA